MQQYKFKSEILDEIKKSTERVLDLNKSRMREEPMSYGIKFLDEATGGGIRPEDFILLSARSGSGKTEAARIIAMANRKKRVHFFALEAATNEIERRIKYALVADVVYGPLRDRFARPNFNYVDWMAGKFDDLLGPFETELNEIVGMMFGNLKTYYQGNTTLNENNIEKLICDIENETDLIIVDHLHYFDFEDENENRAMKKTVKTLKRLSERSGKPIVLLAHLRKSDRRYATLVPTLDEIHGTSDIGKQCTTAVMLSSAKMQMPSYQFATHIALAKFRYDMSRTKYASICAYDVKKNAYQDKYYLGRISFDETKLEPAVPIPYWAPSAIALPEEE